MRDIRVLTLFPARAHFSPAALKPIFSSLECRRYYSHPSQSETGAHPQECALFRRRLREFAVNRLRVIGAREA